MLAQKFVFQAAGDGCYTIRNAASGMMLDVYGGYQDAGTNVQQHVANDSGAQLWSLESAGDGYYYIKAKCNGLYLDLANISTAGGNNIQVYTGNKTNAQKWLLSPVDTLTDGVYYVTVPEDTSYGWNVAGDSTENGASVHIWSNIHPVAIQHNSDGYYTMRFLHSDKYFDIAGSGTASGTGIIQWEDGTCENHKFLVIPNANGTYSFVGKCNGLYVDRKGGGAPSNGQTVQCYTGNGTTAQNWTLIPCKTVSDGVYQLGANGDAGYVMDVTGHGTTEGAKVQLLKNAKADGQRFAIEYRGDGNYTVRDTHSNRYLDVYEGRKVNDTSLGMYESESDTVNANKLFRVIPLCRRHLRPCLHRQQPVRRSRHRNLCQTAPRSTWKAPWAATRRNGACSRRRWISATIPSPSAPPAATASSWIFPAAARTAARTSSLLRRTILPASASVCSRRMGSITSSGTSTPAAT